jgi:cyclic pyranopterin phosphate synthase
MLDTFNRTIDYLRISITDRCNLRCIYCMPRSPLSRSEILSYEEILRIVRIMAPLGIRKIKITGGEPLVRRGAVGLIGEVKRTAGIEKVTITSNGVLLLRCLDDILRAGIDGINVSLDTLDGETFSRITGAGGVASGVNGPAAGAADNSFSGILSFLDLAGNLPVPVKINCVPIKGVNSGELAAIAGLAKSSGVFVRFIELMPLGCAAAFEGVPGREIAAILETAYGPLEPCREKPGNGPASYYSIKGFAGKIGFISPLSHKFCGNCNRLRLGSAGLLRPCLAYNTGLDLRGLLRGGETDEGIARAITALAAKKGRGHNFSGARGAHASYSPVECTEMFRIGG